MVAKETRIAEHRDEAESIRRAVVRVFARDGVLDDDEMAVVRLIADHETGLEATAEDHLAAITLLRRGRHSKHARTQIHDLYPDGPEAA